MEQAMHPRRPWKGLRLSAATEGRDVLAGQSVDASKRLAIDIEVTAVRWSGFPGQPPILTL